MTELLEKAISAASKLPPKEQDAVALLVLEEIDSERRWDRAFSATADKLSQLAESALQEHKCGQTRPLDPLEL